MRIQDEASKRVSLYAGKTKTSDKFLQYCCEFGPPIHIRNYNEPAFISDSKKKLNDKLVVEWHKNLHTIAYLKNLYINLQEQLGNIQ